MSNYHVFDLGLINIYKKGIIINIKKSVIWEFKNMETLQLSDIIKDFNNNIRYSKRNHFISCFNKHMKNKYGEKKNKKTNINAFYKDYQKLVVKAAKILDDDYDISIDALKKRFYRIFNDPSYDCIKSSNKSTFNISRLTVIHIAFVLTDKLNEDADRLEIANELLLSLGYPQLRASSIIEIFLIYALNQKLSYDACVRKYNEFVNTHIYSSTDAQLFAQKTTTIFQKQVCDKKYKNDEELYEDVSSILNSMRDTSLKIKENFCKTLEEIKSNRRMSKIRIQCEFFLTFVASGQKAQQMFNLKFPLTTGTGKTRDEYFDEIDNLSLKGMCFVPIGKVDSKKSFKARTIIDDLDKVEKGKTMLSREAYLLWLLYCGYDTQKINLEISCRYEPLNEDVYFDNFITTVGRFKLSKNEQGVPVVEYKDVYKNCDHFIVKDDIGILNTKNDFTLRQSIIDIFIANFDKNFAAERFVNSKDSTVDKIV